MKKKNAVVALLMAAMLLLTSIPAVLAAEDNAAEQPAGAAVTQYPTVDWDNKYILEPNGALYSYEGGKAEKKLDNVKQYVGDVTYRAPGAIDTDGVLWQWTTFGDGDSAEEVETKLAHVKKVAGEYVLTGDGTVWHMPDAVINQREPAKLLDGVVDIAVGTLSGDEYDMFNEDIMMLRGDGTLWVEDRIYAGDNRNEWRYSAKQEAEQVAQLTPYGYVTKDGSYISAQFIGRRQEAPVAVYREIRSEVNSELLVKNDGATYQLDWNGSVYSYQKVLDTPVTASQYTGFLSDQLDQYGDRIWRNGTCYLAASGDVYMRYDNESATRKVNLTGVKAERFPQYYESGLFFATDGTQYELAGDGTTTRPVQGKRLKDGRIDGRHVLYAVNYADEQTQVLTDVYDAYMDGYNCYYAALRLDGSLWVCDTYNGGTTFQKVLDYEPAPEQKGTILQDSATGVMLEAPAGVLPAGTQMQVTPVKSGESYVRAVGALDGKADAFLLYDITLLNDGVTVQPNGKVKARIPVPEGYPAQRVVVVRVNGDGSLTNMNAVVADGYAAFETDHFSLYAVAQWKPDAALPSGDTADLNPATGDGAPVIVLAAAAGAALVLLGMKKRKKA